MSRSGSSGPIRRGTSRIPPWVAAWVYGAGCFLPVTALLVTAPAAADTAPSDEPFGGTITAAGTTITVRARGPTPDIGASAMEEWIQRSAGTVRGYFGEFPVKALTIQVSTMDSVGMGSGRTFGYPHPLIEVTVGMHITRQALTDDWVLVHEMTHLSLPQIADNQNWLAEGVATYVEGVARTQAANMSEAQLWSEYVTSMPKGLPGPGDRGLDHTHTWARTYWGGALYCLLADVRIRAQTHNRHGLQDALRAIAHSGAGMSSEWPIERIAAVGDSATGTSVMTDLYHQMKDAPFAPDLNALWRDLGIGLTDGVMEFDDSARLASVRRGITGVPAAASP